VVICENIGRTARRMFEGLSIERELHHLGVELCAANEPIAIDGGRSQQILQRRINQSVSEWQVMDLLEQSWGGLCTHVRDGYNIGKPPHGYRAKIVRHPNAAKAERGATKMLLEPDGLRAQTITQMANWRYYEKLGYSEIADRLNADPDRYPPPMPPGGAARARGAWGKSSVRELLSNPKYTGFQVFNRRAMRSRKGAHNEPAKWVFSKGSAHEPLIPMWMWEEINKPSYTNRGSRAGGEPNAHPATKRTYVLHGMVICDCGRKMFGRTRKSNTYYACQPKANNRGRPDNYAGHPRSIDIREDAVLDAVAGVLARRVFGPQRAELLAADIAGADDRAVIERDHQRDRLQRKIADLARRQNTIMRQAQTLEPEDPFAQGLRETYNELHAERQAALAAVGELDKAEAAEPARPNPADAALLDALPYLAMNRPPEALLRQLYETLQLTVQIHPTTHEATVTITLPADELDNIAAAATAAYPKTDAPEHTESGSADDQTASVADVDGAPGRALHKRSRA